MTNHNHDTNANHDTSINHNTNANHDTHHDTSTNHRAHHDTHPPHQVDDHLEGLTDDFMEKMVAATYDEQTGRALYIRTRSDRTDPPADWIDDVERALLSGDLDPLFDDPDGADVDELLSALDGAWR